MSASEAARKLLEYGVEVQRQVEASYLRLPYTLDRENSEGRVVIESQWKPYTPRELWELEMERERFIDEAEQYRDRSRDRAALRADSWRDLLAVNPETIRRAAAAGKLRSVRVGSERRYPESAVREWLSDGEPRAA